MNFCQRTVLVALIIVAASAQAAIPGSLNYQSYLTNADGSVVDSTVTITFAIFGTDFGGAPLWMESRPVDVDQGLFAVTLGNPLNPFPVGLFDNPLWIGIDVEGDGEMMPRSALTSAAYSFTSDNAFTLQGQGPAVYNQSAHVVDTGNPHSVSTGQIGAATNADIASLQSQLNAATANITTLQNDLAAALATISTLQTAIDNEAVTRGNADTNHDSQIAAIESNTVLGLDGVLTLPDANTALISGVNLQVINGDGVTSGTPNGVGNIIVGYDVDRTAGGESCSLGQFDDEIDCTFSGGIWAISHKSGSHNIVVGDRQNYSSNSGIVTGNFNDISNFAAAAIGGSGNRSRGNNAVIVGGQSNEASGAFASLLGGTSNEVSGTWSSATGGRNNLVTGLGSTITGGGGSDTTHGNRVDGDYGSINGGRSNIVGLGTNSGSVSGGFGNLAGGDFSHVSGGRQNFAHGYFSVVAGGNSNESGDTTLPADDAGNRYMVVTGGQFNKAKAQYSVVSGGSSKSALGTHDWVAGSLFQDQ